MITIDDFKKVEIKVGQVLSAEKVEGADELIKCMVDFKEEAPRQIVSGIAQHVPDLESLVGKKFVYVTNLESRTIKGVESQGMIMAVTDVEGHFSLLQPEQSILPGSSIS